MEIIKLDTASEEFARIKEIGLTLEKEEWSETDTRSKLIDSLLIQCLGWTESDIRRELSEDRSRLDYQLSITKPKLVIEAKRIAIPLATKCPASPNRVLLESLKKSYPDIDEHIAQVARYCQDFSIPLGVLTNGRTYFFLCAIRSDTVPWRKGYAIVLNNIFDPNFSLATIYGLLSREALRTGELARALQYEASAINEKTILSLYHDPRALKPQNDLAEHLEKALKRVFTDVINDDSAEIIQHCYVKPAETTLRNDAIEFPLLDRPEQDDLTMVDVSNLNAFKQFERTISEHLMEGNSGSTLLLIGNMGVGKTMFLRRFFMRECNKEYLPDKAIPFFIDYRAGTLDPQRTVEDVYDRLRLALNEIDSSAHANKDTNLSNKFSDLSSPQALRVMFQSDMQRFERNHSEMLKSNEYPAMECREFMRLQGDNKQFVRAAFKYLRQSCGFSPCLILDNADHHSATFQRHVYLAAKTLEQELGCLVLLSLQETWYWHFRHENNVLSYYQDKVFHIPAPRTKDVLAKRLDFAISISSELFKGINVRLGSITLEPSYLTEYLKICKTTLFDSEEISVFFEALANGNIRKGLELFATFVRSGHTNVMSYLYTVVLNRPTGFSLDDVIRSIACNRYRWYASERSLVPNIFLISKSKVNHEFLRFGACFVLQYLSARLRKDRNNELGFVARTVVLRMCQELGLSEEDANNLVNGLEKNELVRGSAKRDESSRALQLRISGLGNYVIKRLIGNAAYLSCVMLETPISSKEVFETIAECYKEHLTVLEERRDKCIREFLNELDQHEESEWNRAQLSLAGAELSRVVPHIRELLGQTAPPNLFSIISQPRND